MVKPIIVSLILAISAVSACAQLYRQNPGMAVAERIEKNYGVKFDPDKTDLMTLLNFESRLSVCARIQRNHRLLFDYRKTSLLDLLDIENRVSCCERLRRVHRMEFDYRTCTVLQLLDVESRLSYCARLKREHQIDCDYRVHTPLQLGDFEARASAAKRLNRLFGSGLDWRSYSFAQLGELEQQMTEAKRVALARQTDKDFATAKRAIVVDEPFSDENPVREHVIAGNDEVKTTASKSTTLKPTGSTPRSFIASSPATGYYSRYYDYSYRPAVGDHYTGSHIRNDGTFVRGHMKTNSDDSFWNNWSSAGNFNPYTSQIGTKRPPYSYVSSRPRSYSVPRISSYGGSSYVQCYTRKNGTYVSGHSRKSR